MSSDLSPGEQRIKLAKENPWPFLIGASANFIDDEAVLAAGEALNQRIVDLESEVDELAESLWDAVRERESARDVLRECRRQLRAREKELGWDEPELTKVGRDV